MNDQQLATVVRRSVEGATMKVPEEQVTGRGRAIRAVRRRLLAAGATVVAVGGAAAIAVTVVLPGAAAPGAPAVQQAQDTAYVVSHTSRALDMVPSDVIFFMQVTGPNLVTKTWARGKQYRTETFRSGQLASESGFTTTGTTRASVQISYRARTWSSESAPFHAASSAPAVPAIDVTCDTIAKYDIPLQASFMATALHTWESCGWLKADGTAAVGGVTAIKLTMPVDSGYIETWYVNPATYLPVRQTISRQGKVTSQRDFQWLSPTAANLASLALPAAPQGFTHVSTSAQR